MPPPGKRGKYLGFVAHEIKNPLATALWSCDLLRRMEPPDRTGERGDKMIEVSLRALRRMRRLIDDYFTIERLQANGYELKKERIRLRELVETSLEDLAEKDGLPTEGWALEIGDGEISGDVEMLRRAVRAVLEHLARAAPKPKLSISSRDRTSLHVRAEAPPSPIVPPDPEDRPSGDPHGSVLGYALAAQILDAHGGRIEERDGGVLLVLPPE